MDVLESWSEDTDYTDYYYNYNYSETFLIKPVEIQGMQVAGWLTATFYSFIILISLTANSFLLWVLVKHKGLASSANLLLLHLTISDLVFTFTLVPWAVFHVCGWLFGELACKLFSGSIFLGFYSYMMFLTCMTVHRYMVVVHALRTSSLNARRGRLYTHLTSAVVWVLSASCSLPEAFFSVTENKSDGMSCTLTYHSAVLELTTHYVQILVFFLLPFLVITFCYVQILATIKRCQIRNRQHTVWLILCTIVGFFICWTPYNVTIFLHSLQLLRIESMYSFAWEKGLAYAYYITHIMAYCHCCFNPLIQIFGGGMFRKYLPSRSGFSRMSERERSQTFSSPITPYQTSVARQTCM
uniref:G-protein coupled receptors family 1 profile domain-containing protein n=2 Tax=Pygocentrus nattereri TaxID=42514 RepID=A0A3B4C4R3_PYGNA